MNRDLWNRCDVCGRIIALKDFLNGATHRLINNPMHSCDELWETLCKEHAKDGRSK
jgi:hypothetical protein